MDIFARLIEIITVPYKDLSMLWEVLPLIATIIIMELYFGRYKEEDLGWNSALSNSLVLIYIGSNLLHFLFLEGEFSFSNAYTYVAIAVALTGFLLAFLDYNHILPRRFTFGISSVLPMNLLSYLAIVFVHGHLLLDLSSLFASLILLASLFIIFTLVHLTQKPKFP